MFTESGRVIDARLKHNCDCSSLTLTGLCCFDEHGIYITMKSCTILIVFFLLGNEHNVRFTSCKCEPLVVTMVRARLWPASPQNPHYAFTFELLDWAEALLLECQVALKDFCQALYFRCQHLTIKVHNN